ncbi:hypothetical protein D3C87_1493640 [compost metagenome]
MILVEPTRFLPALPDFGTCLCEHFFVGGVFPLDKLLHEREEAHTLLLGLLLVDPST